MHALLTVLTVALVTAALRFAPFLLFSGKRETPGAVLYLGQALPCAVMGMLVVYCLRSLHFTAPSGYLPALLASAAVALLHVWKRSSLLSILGGTAIYMLLIRLF